MKDFTTTIKNIRKNLELSSRNPYEEEWGKYLESYGAFYGHLARAFQEADLKNLKRLEEAFPEVSKAFCLWKSVGRTDKVSEL